MDSGMRPPTGPPGLLWIVPHLPTPCPYEDDAIMSDDKPTRVFISYSHDSDAHRERVLGLSERLRADGIESILDQYVNGSPQQGWPRWMLDQLDAADAVLVVCTETYYRRFRGHRSEEHTSELQSLR